MTEHLVDPCPRCHGRHTFTIDDGVVPPRRSALIFSGSASASVAQGIRVTCPTTGEWIELARAVSPGDTDDGSELQEWKRESLTVGRDFGRSMLVMAGGTLPLLAAAAKYLGIEDGTTLSKALFAVGFIMLIAATVGFGLATAPSLRHVDEARFEQFRDKRLKGIAAGLQASLLLYGIAMTLTAAAFGFLLLE